MGSHVFAMIGQGDHDCVVKRSGGFQLIQHFAELAIDFGDLVHLAADDQCFVGLRNADATAPGTIGAGRSVPAIYEGAGRSVPAIYEGRSVPAIYRRSTGEQAPCVFYRSKVHPT